MLQGSKYGFRQRFDSGGIYKKLQRGRESGIDLPPGASGGKPCSKACCFPLRLSVRSRSAPIAARAPFLPARNWSARLLRRQTCTWLERPFVVRVVEVLLLAREERPFVAREAEPLSLARVAARLSLVREAEPLSLVGPITEASGTAPGGAIGTAAGGPTALAPAGAVVQSVSYGSAGNCTPVNDDRTNLRKKLNSVPHRKCNLKRLAVRPRQPRQ